MAMEKEEAGFQRFFITEGYCWNRQIIDIIRNNFPEYKSAAPLEVHKEWRLVFFAFTESRSSSNATNKSAELPDKVYKVNNKRSIDVLGMKYRSFEECVADNVLSFGSTEKEPEVGFVGMMDEDLETAT